MSLNSRQLQGTLQMLYISITLAEIVTFHRGRNAEAEKTRDTSQVSELVVYLPKVCLSGHECSAAMPFTPMSLAMHEVNTPIWQSCVWHLMQRGLRVSTLLPHLGSCLPSQLP